jgi:hypothetical protein
MPKTHKRKYEKTDDAEIDLVVQCKDSHEFYERYREAFPDRKKGIESIGKIWKRRGEFLKKRQMQGLPDESAIGSVADLEKLILAQNTILAEISGMMREQLGVSKEILAHVQAQNTGTGDHPHKHKEAKSPDQKAAEQKEPAKKAEKPSSIVVGS